MTENRHDMRSAFIAATVTVGLHGALGFAFFVLMLFVVPRFKQLFAEFGMKLPWATEKIIGISDWLVNYWYVAVLVALALLALDGAIVFLCWQRRSTRIVGILWVLLLLVLWLVMMAAAALLIGLAYFKLQEGLSR
jgi:type IV pilus assembly protein PilC